MLFAKVRPLDRGIVDHLLRRALGDLLTGVQHHHALGKAHHRAHDVLDHDHRDAALVEAEQDLEDVVDLGAGQARHRLVRDQKRGARPRPDAGSRRRARRSRRSAWTDPRPRGCAQPWRPRFRHCSWISPTMPWGATMMKITSSTPTISTLASDEIVTVTISWIEPSSSAPTTGPNQVA